MSVPRPIGGYARGVPERRSPSGIALRVALGCAALAAGVLVPAAGSGAALACNPPTGGASAFCVRASLKPSTTRAGAPVGARVAIDNTSQNLANEKAKWLERAVVRLFSGAPRLITPSAELPNRLLIAGEPEGGTLCRSADDFTRCRAGRGTLVATVNGSPTSGTFGVHSISNVRNAGAGNRALYRVDAEGCLNGLGCRRLPFNIPIPEGTSELRIDTRQQVNLGFINLDASLDSFRTRIRGRSGKLLDGSSAGRVYTIARLPSRCGPRRGRATLTSGDGRSVTIRRTINVTGCAR
jgi:hypothetical protein